MQIKTKASIIIIIGFIIVITSQYISAIDAPHSASNNVYCGSCHGETLLNSPFWGGSGSYDQLCLSCHTAPFGEYSDINAPLVKTHSSLTTSNKYGDWTRECRNCHDPHYQRQKNYKPTDASRLYLATGTITACVYNGDGTSTLTYSTITYKTGWDSTKLTAKTGDYRRTILFPNVSKLGYNYPLVAIDTVAKRITVTGDATVYLYPPTTFAATYGQYIKDIMDISADGSGVNKTVKFFDQTGVNSFADGNSTYDGVCEVCHTQTNHFRNNGGAPDQNHSNIGGAAGVNCSTCHSHVDGFKPSCASCHGYPPPPLASIPLPTGSATAGEHVFHVTTKGYQCPICHYNSTGSGPTHNDNKITLGFVSLLGAYTGGSYDGQTSANYESSDPGTTVSKTGLKKCSNLYCHGGTMAPDGGTGSAIWDTPSSAACGTCHGASTSNSPTRGSHSKHVGERHLACTVCHSGYTSAHLNGSVNWAYDTATYTWLSGALYRGTASGSAAPVPSSSYGQCSNLYCHSIAQTSTGGALTPDTSDYKTPTWGQTFSGICGGGACHNVGYAHLTDSGYTALTSGSHGKHLLYKFDQVGNCQACHFDYSYCECDNCHTRNVNHVNGSIEMAFDPEFPAKPTGGGGGSYSGDSVPGTPYGSCSNLYCHSPGTKAAPPYDSPNTTNITWGTTPLPGDCTGCHNGDNNATNKMSTGSHLRHILSYDCSLCHKFTVSNSRTLNPQTYGGNLTYGHRYHVNGWVTIVFDSTAAVNGTYAGQTSPINYRAPGSAYGTCTNIFCHSDGTNIWTGGTPSGTTPQWGSGSLGCNGCHGNTTYTDYRKGTPLYTSYPAGTKPNAHQLHTDARTTPSGEPQCNNCHRSVTNTNTAIDGTTPSDHVNGVYNVVGGNTYKDGDNVGGGAVSVTTTYSYSGTPNTSTCSNVSCHPTGLAGTKAASTTKWSNAYSCTDCHKINMNNTSGYHHVMDATAMADRTYPTSVPTSSATDPNRKCTMCHVDHNILSPILNASNTTGRSMNLRTAIGTTPTSTTGYTNSDYASGGGICISCHTNELTKNTTAQKSGTSSTTMAVTNAVYSASAHQNNMTSTMSNGGSTFSSNCSKCHNAKNGETTTFQSSANKFGTHDSTGERLLFDTSDNFCFDCHNSTPYPNYTAVVNRSYSYRAGNYSADTLNNISSAFSLSSTHKLSDIKTFINGKWGYTASSNPCDACHNPHIVQGDPANLPNAAKSPTTRGYPMARPSQHATNYNNLWGDSTGEKMSDYTTQYQAPYRYGSTSTYEPDGSSTQDGSNLTDYNTFCTDCHNATNTIYSTTLGRNLKTIDWLTSAGELGGDKHGKNVATTDTAANIKLKNPYLGVWTTAGLVLACTDCHEPHGSPNVFLLRNEVNGGVLTNSITAFSLNLCSFPDTVENNVLGSLCNRCHKDDHDLDPGNFPTPNTWKYVHHYGSSDYLGRVYFPYIRTECYRCHSTGVNGSPITCNCCHYHGASTTDYGVNYPCYYNNPNHYGCNTPYDRRTF